MKDNPRAQPQSGHVTHKPSIIHNISAELVSGWVLGAERVHSADQGDWLVSWPARMGDSLGLVGKRLLCLFRDRKAVADISKETQALQNRDWLRGTVRAVSVIGLDSPGVEVFVEFEECPWRQRSWVHIYGEDVSVVLVESVIVRAVGSDALQPAEGSTTGPAWPALSYRPLVDRVGLGSLVPVESFVDRSLHFLPDGESLEKFEVNKEQWNSLLPDQSPLRAAVRSWHKDSEVQDLLRRGSCSIMGRRVRVYQPEFDQPWALGQVSLHNPPSHIMEVTIDQTEEKQLVDPRVIHVMLVEDSPQEAGEVELERMEDDGGKVENGRRRKNPSEEDGGVVLKRPKNDMEEGQDPDSNNNVSGGASMDRTNDDATRPLGEHGTISAAMVGGGGGPDPAVRDLGRSSPPLQVCETGAPSGIASPHIPKLDPPIRSGYHMESPKPPVTAANWFQKLTTPVFGELHSRTPTQPNGTPVVSEGKVSGFGFGSEGQLASSQNLFFQCMATGAESGRQRLHCDFAGCSQSYQQLFRCSQDNGRAVRDRSGARDRTKGAGQGRGVTEGWGSYDTKTFQWN
ncbi:hypothetical protein GJAV_G00134540 [Gymnothorax javanicus]|nr:hypothetical protein GJAV_G00134540 [Gymnothorax javanicus]